MTTTDTVWNTWATTPSTTTDDVWNTWATTTAVTPSYYTWRVWVSAEQAQQIIADQQQVSEAAQRQMAEQQERQRAEEEKRQAAKQRADELLRAHLSVKQRQALDKHGWFLVQGGKSKKTYRVHGDKYAGNIHELDQKGKEVARYCVHAEYTIPLGDQLLAQALCLSHDEDHIIGKANRTPLAA